MTTQQSVPIQTGYGIVKQVISGDTIVLKGQPKRSGPPDEITIILTGIQAGKLARRPTTTAESTKDEPYAWEAREFLRQKLVGKRVFFTFEKAKGGEKSSTGGAREYGIVYNGTDANSENVAESLISEGLASVRSAASRSNEYIQKLRDLEEIAKTSAKGKHGPNAAEHVRDIRWSIDNPQLFKDTYHQKPLKAVVEHVVDGSTVRVLLYSNEFPEYYYIKLMLSGIRCNGFPGDDSNKPPEPFAEEAKYFIESRLLQRDVEVLLESVSNKNFLGTILHPKGNITELLLTEGYAKCVDWSLQCVTSGIEKLRAAEKLAKERRLRIWKEYAPSGPVIDAKEKEFQGKVVEIMNADAMNVKLADASVKKIFLASIRPPRFPENASETPKTKSKPLYDVPYMFEAREFLRKKLIGKKVNVTIDYKQPANNNFPEKTCCTVTIGGINVAEALVSKGLATVVRYRADDDQRSAHYDELLSAETKAVKSGKGLHSKKEAPVLRIVDLSGDLKLSKQYFPLIQRAGRTEALVEFVASGSRLRLFLPRQNYLITFLLGGISCARASRDNGLTPGEPFGDEALAYTKDLCLQKEVQIEAESMDKGGNFIGWLWIDNVNLSEALVQEGFAEVFATASRSPYYRALQAAQEDAQKKKLRRWEKFEPVQPELKEDKSDRIVNFKLVTITETKDDAADLSFYAQHFDEGPKLDELMNELREEFESSPPYPGNYVPTKNDICAAKYSADNQWYRARILKNAKDGVLVSFIDFGNKEVLLPAKLAALPAKYKSLPPCAHEYALAFVKLPKDVESASDARAAFFDETVQHSSLRLNIEYKNGSLSHVTLLTTDEKEDIGKKLVEKGYALVDRRPEKKFYKLISEYLSAQETAKKNRANLWVYGDITEDDAKEFG
ncbi:staphylococcal nuclease domain-containing protein 1 [Parasteatoda tepidariorum]|uniref:staphylococcal nuclease domain-containing protein 1 n=1 Tax=Parasteatoda tepidariorum TaxID=114398 RepID=UPI001C7261BF|nr:staphylococcal nuclease domain-containing protein 1 [Parasteatoda tepidariorum]